MWKLVNEHAVPSGGWRYRVSQTGIVVTAGSFNQLQDMVRRHYAANRIPVPGNLTDMLLKYACETYAACEQDGVPNNVNSPSAVKSIWMHDVVRFSKTLFDALVNGKRVDQQEANRRAAICLNCPFNKKVEGCTSCNSGLMSRMVKALSQAGTTPVDARLHSCEFCGCFIAAMVHFPLESLQKYIDDKENASLPEWCWKKRNA